MANNNHFELNLDTTAPTGSITANHRYINANEALTINTGDASYMQVWYSTSAAGSKSDANYPGEGNFIPAATSFTTEFNTDGNYYYHLILIDSVYNESVIYNTTVITYDSTAPTISDFYVADHSTGDHTITNDLTVDYYIAFSDAGSGAVTAKITGTDLTDTTINLTTSPATGTISFASSATDGSKNLSVRVTDAAGNYSDDSCTILLDRAISNPSIVLKESDGTTPLPGFINYTSFKALLNSTDSDIVGYKVWEAGTTEPAYTTVTAQQLVDVLVPVTVTSTSGTKTILAKIIDAAGNEESASTTPSVYVDLADPVVTISSNKTHISNVSGYETAVLTLSGTDSESGIASWDLLCGSTSIKGSLTTIPATFALTSANAMTPNVSNTITLTATDQAGNTAAATCTVFLDTIAPTASLADMNAWYNAKPSASVSFVETGAGVGTIWAWISNVPTDTTVPGSAVPTTDPAQSPVAISSANIGGTLNQGTNYMHVKVMDKVGNASFDHEEFGYDDVVPTVTANFTKGTYDTVNATLQINGVDATSGLYQMQITGDFTSSPTGWIAYNSTYSVVLTTGDGTKNVSVLVKDNAGNISTVAGTASCELDTQETSATIEVHPSNNADALHANPSNDPLMVLRISVNKDESTVQYKVWGDYTVGVTPAASGTTEPATWSSFSYDSGKQYQSITGLVCTANSGEAGGKTKTFYLKIKDAAENEKTVNTSFVYDNSAPEIDVTEGQAIVSLIHKVRRSDASTLIPGDYADECAFSFTANQDITAHKVCAYATKQAANAGTHSDAAIPETAGSTNMNVGTEEVLANTDINCLIKGADYKTALGGASAEDGVHYVVIYAKDAAGNWSAAAQIPVS